MNAPVHPSAATINATLHAVLLTQERRLLDPAIRRQRHLVAAMLAEEFREFGSSGRAYSKAQILDALQHEPEQRIELHDFAAVFVGEAAALATYRSAGPRGEALRSSLWVWREGQWLLAFHQGTAIGTSLANEPTTAPPSEQG